MIVTGTATAQVQRPDGQAGANRERVIGTFHLRPTGEPQAVDPSQTGKPPKPLLTPPSFTPPSFTPPSMRQGRRVGEEPRSNPGRDSDPLDVLQAAVTALEVGDERQARALLRRVIAMAPASPEANRARRHLRELGVDPADVARAPAPQAPEPQRRHTRAEPELQSRSRLASYEQDFISIAGDRVFFGLGSSKLGGRARRVLAGQAKWLNKHPQVSMIIEGHSDDGNMTDDQQQTIARARAAAVLDRLVQEGVDSRRLEVQSLGRTRPVATCPDAACAAQNRRVVTVLHFAPVASALPPTVQHWRSEGAGTMETGNELGGDSRPFPN